MRIETEREALNHTSKEFLPQTIYSSAYRSTVIENLIKTTDVEQVIVFDDVAHAVPPSQRQFLHGLPGYERGLIPAIPFTEQANVVVIMQLPPLPQEMELVESILQRSAKYQYQVLVPSGNSWKDAFSIYQQSKESYHQLLRESREQTPTDDPDFHLKAIEQLQKKGLIGQKRSLVLPFQTRDLHFEAFEKLIRSGQFVLPSSTEGLINKGRAHQLYREEGLGEYLPDFVYIEVPSNRRSPERENKRMFIEELFRALLELEGKGKTGYIKTVATGVSGIGNLSPSVFPEVYSQKNSPNERKEALNIAVFGRNGSLSGNRSLPEGAVVEEYLSIASDSLGRREWVVSGMMIDGIFYPWICTRTLNNKQDIYVGTIASTRSDIIGLNPIQFNKIVKTVDKFAEASAKINYHLGYLAKDAVSTDKGRIVVHDHNDRRGGRSTVEQLIAIAGKEISFIDRDFEFPIPHNDNPLDFALKMAKLITDNGYYIYGSNTTAFPSKGSNGQKILKFKILVPLEQSNSPSREELQQTISKVQSLGEK